MPTSNLPVISRARRALATLIDLVVCIFFFGVISTVCGLLFDVSFGKGALDALYNDVPNPIHQSIGLAIAGGSLFVCWLYFAQMDSSRFRGTLGKLATDIQVVNYAGEQISSIRATLRFVLGALRALVVFIIFLSIAGMIACAFSSKQLSNICLGGGMLCAFVTVFLQSGKRGQRLQDLFSRSRVVRRDWQPPSPAEKFETQHAPRGGKQVVVSCPKCSQQLRLPARCVLVRCPTCKFQFNGEPPKTPQSFDQNVGTIPVSQAQSEKPMHETGASQNANADLLDAIQQYRQIAEQGNAETQYQCAFALAKGLGMEKNLTEATKWYRKSAEQNYAPAQNNLGCCYANGDGVEKDLAQAFMWFSRAAEQEYPEAQYNLGRCYEHGAGIEKDFVKAGKWYRQAAEQNYLTAQFSLAEFCFNGLGVLQDYLEAVKWYVKAAEGGIVQAQFKLGFIFVNGNEMDDLIKKASHKAVDNNPSNNLPQSFFASYKEGVKKGCKIATDERFKKRFKYALGKNRYPLLGVKSDLVAAYKWMSMAAIHRYEDSVELTEFLATLMTEEEIAKGRLQVSAILKSK